MQLYWEYVIKFFFWNELYVLCRKTPLFQNLLDAGEMDSLLSTLISVPILWFIYYLVLHLGHCCKSTLDWVTRKINFSVSEIRKSKIEGACRLGV